MYIVLERGTSDLFRALSNGKASQVDPMKPMLKLPGIKRMETKMR